MKKKLGVKPKRALADFLPTVTLKAKEFASAISHEGRVAVIVPHGVLLECKSPKVLTKRYLNIFR